MIYKPSGNCPCKSQLKYALCCGRYHKSKLYAPTAEALMRSRYSAYALQDAQYIYRTWDETTRPNLQSLRESFKSDNNPKYLSLEIVSTSEGGAVDDIGTVEFIAAYGEITKPQSLHEISYFRRNKGRWVYLKAL